MQIKLKKGNKRPILVKNTFESMAPGSKINEDDVSPLTKT